MIKYLHIVFFIAGCLGQINDGRDKNNKNNISNKHLDGVRNTKDISDGNNNWMNPENRVYYLPSDLGWPMNNKAYNNYNWDEGLFKGDFQYSPSDEKIKGLNDKTAAKKDDRNIDDNIRVIGPKDNEDNRRQYRIDAGNPDIYGIIERPCEVYDLICIRRFFAEHSKCRKVKGPVPEPLYRNQANLYFTRANMSASYNNAEYRGINNARVEEFYINKATDNLLITLGFNAISLSSNNSYVRFHINRREPITTRDVTWTLFRDLSITVIIPKINDLQLEKAEITTFADSIPLFTTGPGLSMNADPVIPIMFAALLANIPADLQEVMLTEGPFYAATHIQHNICDFGLKVE